MYDNIAPKYSSCGFFIEPFSGNIRSRDAFRPIARERKYLMDYKFGYRIVRDVTPSYLAMINRAVTLFKSCSLRTLREG